MSGDDNDEKALLKVGDIGDFIGLSKPAEKFVGDYFASKDKKNEANYIINMAKAKAKSDKIEAKSKGKLAKIEQKNKLQKIKSDEKEEKLRARMVSRKTDRFMEQQENIENIVFMASEKVKKDCKLENVDKSWLRHHEDLASNVYDEEAQKMWADILAGEVNSPGSFSKKTLSILQILSKKDAELFEKLCGFNCNVGDSSLSPLIYEPNGDMYTQFGIDFDKLLHLSDLGLIEFQPVSLMARFFSGPLFFFIYCDNFANFEMSKNKSGINIGHCVYTQAGQELAKICSSQKIDGFLEYALKKIKEGGNRVKIRCSIKELSPKEKAELKETGIDIS